MEISGRLGLWYEKVKRDLPWRNSKDPYEIWISEIILQQTRVAQGIAYYHSFLNKFPDVFRLAKADTDEVLKIWQGLGYYSRARNLHETARLIASERDGIFPSTYSGLIKLKGIGEYTAAAISSIAFNEPVAAIDGNVSRVISRLFLVEVEINSPAGKKAIKSLAQEILDTGNPGRHNQAVMELGASICLPRKPLCHICPVNSNCLALKEKMVSDLPLKYQKTKPRDRFFTYLIILIGNKILLHQRKGSDIWQGLFEFPLIETSGNKEISDYPGMIATTFNADINTFTINKVSSAITHKLTHLNIICRFLHISFNEEVIFSFPGFKKVTPVEFAEYAVPKLIERYISENGF